MKTPKTYFTLHIIKRLVIILVMLIPFFFINSSLSNSSLKGSDDTFISGDTYSSHNSYSSNEIEISLYVSNELTKYYNRNITAALEKIIIEGQTFYPHNETYSLTVRKKGDIDVTICFSEYNAHNEYVTTVTYESELDQNWGSILAMGAGINYFDSQYDMKEYLSTAGFSEYNDDDYLSSLHSRTTEKGFYKPNTYNDHFIMNTHAILSQWRWGWNNCNTITRNTETYDEYSLEHHDATFISSYEYSALKREI